MKVVQTDILIIGGGIAGCFAAIKAREEGRNVAILDKATLRRGGSVGPGMDHVSLGIHPQAITYEQAREYAAKSRKDLQAPNVTLEIDVHAYERVQDMGVASTLGLSLPIAAGATVAGAYFGDKLSPLSDTTVLASAVTNTDLFEHIRHMLWTTAPASILGLVVYFIVGINTHVDGAGTMELVDTMVEQMDRIYNWNLLLLLPVVIVLAGCALKFPTVPVMIVSSVVACILAMIFQGFSFNDVCTVCASGFSVNMINRPDFDPSIIVPQLTKLINRGGMSGMMETVLITLIAFSYGGIVSCTGCLDLLLDKLQTKVKTDSGIITSTVVASLLMSLVAGVSTLSIIVTGELFTDVYKKRGLASCNLSRTLEDSGTVVTSLIPWTGGAVYMSSTLGVATLEYLPWAIMNYTGFIFAIIWAFTGIGIKRIPKRDVGSSESK